jgi:hypothetical protein
LYRCNLFSLLYLLRDLEPTRCKIVAYPCEIEWEVAL